MRLNLYLTALVFLLLLPLGQVAWAQQEFTMYHMPVLSQSTYLNPAAVPEHKVSVSIPGLFIPSTFVGFNNSSINVKSLLTESGTVDYDKFVDRLKKNNYFGQAEKIELFHARFKVADNFFSLSSQYVADLRLNYPKELLAIASTGISDDYSLLGLNLRLNSYLEYAVGFTRAKPDSKWTYGGKFKWLNGIANIQTKNTEINLKLNQDSIYSYDAEAKMLINVGAGVDGNKYTSIEDIQNIEINNFNDFWREFKPNNGAAIDLGATFQFTDKLSFGASLLDVGFIKWKSFVQNFTVNSQIAVKGIAADITGDTNLDSLFNAQVDSLLQSYEDEFKAGVDTTNNAYTTWQPAKLFLSANYQLTPKLRTTASVYTEFYEGVSVGAVVGANYRFGRTFNLTTSWWWFNNSAANLGVGLVFKPWFAQFYLIMDNVLPGKIVKINDPELQVRNLTLPYQAKNFNLRIGMNIVFGKIREVNRLPLDGLIKQKDGKRKYLYKPPFKH